jgi:glycosyltransferase involved in cell wall biosynthesis
MTFKGVVNVREALADIDLVVLPSYNEGQPVVVLEAMTAGIPVAGTKVGGMAQLIDDPLTTTGGRTWGPCGLLVTPDYQVVMANVLQRFMGDVDFYETCSVNGRGRVEDFFQLQDAMLAYNRLYREVGGIPRERPTDREQVRVVDPREAAAASPRIDNGLAAGRLSA